MSETTIYEKSACDHCAGRIEFPAEMAGTNIPCPHCGVMTKLVPPMQAVSAPAKPRIRKRIVLPIVFAVIACGLLLAALTSRRSLTVREIRFDRATTNSAGAVSGVVENKSSRPRRNVRVEINLLNARGETLWQATDHAAQIPARGAWQFRALVLDAAVVTGKVARVRSE